ncbi:MAG: PilZ domain-containing protein [Desulfobulbus sp.]|nr:MAG: PilZ domain-containing protein [Desulfobulbus sp.]
MDSTGADKRRHQRIYFSDEMVVGGVVVDPSGPAEIPVKILNLSESGIFFMVARDRSGSFLEKGTLLFKDMFGPAPFNLSADIQIKIKWIWDSAVLDNIGCGCEYIDPPPRFVEQARRMVEEFLAGGIQYEELGDDTWLESGRNEEK